MRAAEGHRQDVTDGDSQEVSHFLRLRHRRGEEAHTRTRDNLALLGSKRLHILHAVGTAPTMVRLRMLAARAEVVLFTSLGLDGVPNRVQRVGHGKGHEHDVTLL